MLNLASQMLVPFPGTGGGMLYCWTMLNQTDAWSDWVSSLGITSGSYFHKRSRLESARVHTLQVRSHFEMWTQDVRPADQ